MSEELREQVDALEAENRKLERQQRKTERDLKKMATTCELYEEECVKRQRLEKKNLLQNVQVNQLSEQLKERERQCKRIDNERLLLKDRIGELELEILNLGKSKDIVSRELQRLKIDLQTEIDDRNEFEQLYKNTLKQLKDKENDIRSIESEKRTLEINLKSSNNRLSALNLEKESLSKTIDETRESLSKSNREVLKLKNQLGTIESEMMTNKSRYNRLEHQLQRQKKDLKIKNYYMKNS